MNNNIISVQPRRSVQLESSELKSLKKLRSKFRTGRDFAEQYGFGRGLVERVLLCGSASEQTVIKIKEILSEDGRRNIK